MLLVDYRKGSKELAPGLEAAGLDVDVVTLPFGDVAFTGRGPNGPVDIGIELKVFGDLVSSLRTERLAGHQLPGLRSHYDYAWLLVEGAWSVNKFGQLCQFKGPRRGWVTVPGKMQLAELENRLLTLELRGGLHVRHCYSRRDTLRFLVSLYRWWTDRAFDSHRSHLAVHVPQPLIEISDFRQAIYKWPGIGLEWSAAAERAFKTVYRAARATVDEWAQLVHEKDGRARHFGRSAATKLVNFLRGED
jgi:ERCC4-type nuclease